MMTSYSTLHQHRSTQVVAACLVLAFHLVIGSPTTQLDRHGSGKSKVPLATCSKMCSSDPISQHCLVLGVSMVTNGSCACHCATCKHDAPFCPDVPDECHAFGEARTTVRDGHPLCCIPCIEVSTEQQQLTDKLSADRLYPMADPSLSHVEDRGPGVEYKKDPFHNQVFPQEAAAQVEDAPTSQPVHLATSPAVQSPFFFCLGEKCPAVPNCISYEYPKPPVGRQCCPKCVRRSCSHCPPVKGCLRFKPRKPGQCCAKCAKRKRVTPVGACATAHCPRNQVCRNYNGKAVCICKLVCPKTINYVCGSDWVTYQNACHMKRESCLTGKAIWWVRKRKC